MENLNALKPSANLTLQWAEKYISLGWSLIPLKPRSKEPLIPWQEFQKRRADMTEAQSWLSKWPEMNLGVVTGFLSQFVVVDLDGATGKEFGRTHKVVSTTMAITGNGKQVFYKWTEHVDNSVSKLAPGVDIRGDGGYVVICPSIHPNGKRYRWERFSPSTLGSIPAKLTGILTANLATVEESKKKPDGWIAKAIGDMTNGNIDDTLVSILGRLRHDNWTPADALALLEPVAREKGATESHVADKIRNVWSRYEPSTRVSVQPSGHMGQGLVLHSPSNPDSLNGFKDSLDTATRPRELESGFPTLDRMCEGGLKSERLFVVAALPNHGKTNFGIALSSNLCQQGKKVLYFSTEYRYQKIWTRYLATLGRDALQRFKEHAFTVVDSYSPNLEQVEEAIKQVQPDVFVFDYIQHVSKEREALTAFMRGAQFLQRQYNTQGVILAQIGRKGDWVENGKRIEPRMSMIEGCSTIEQAASRVLLLSETRVTPEKNEIVGVLDKNDTGDKGIINFELLKHPYIFKEAI